MTRCLAWSFCTRRTAPHYCLLGSPERGCGATVSIFYLYQHLWTKLGLLLPLALGRGEPLIGLEVWVEGETLMQTCLVTWSMGPLFVQLLLSLDLFEHDPGCTMSNFRWIAGIPRSQWVVLVSWLLGVPWPNKYSCYCLLTHKSLMTLMTWCHKYSEQVMFCGISRCFRPPWIYDDRMKENEQSPVRVRKENCGWILLFIPCEYELFWTLLSAGYGKESIYQIKSCLSFTCNYTNSL